MASTFAEDKNANYPHQNVATTPVTTEASSTPVVTNTNTLGGSSKIQTQPVQTQQAQTVAPEEEGGGPVSGTVTNAVAEPAANGAVQAGPDWAKESTAVNQQGWNPESGWYRDPTMPNADVQNQLQKDLEDAEKGTAVTQPVVKTGEGGTTGGGSKTAEPSGTVAGGLEGKSVSDVAKDIVENPTKANISQPGGTVTPDDLNAKVSAQWQQKQADDLKNAWENPTQDFIRKSGLSYGDFMAEARKAGYNPNALSVLNAFYGKDPSKSLEENEKAEKKAKNQEKMNLIGNAIMHLGNFIGAAAGKGHASVPLESPVEYTKRQQALKDKTEALKTKTWQDYYNQLKDQRTDDANKASLAYKNRVLQETMDKNAKEALRKAEEAKIKAEHQEKADKLAQDKFEHQKEVDEDKSKINHQNADSREHSAYKVTGGRSGGSGGRVKGSQSYTDTTTKTNKTTGETTTTVKHHQVGGTQKTSSVPTNKAGYKTIHRNRQ